MNPSNNNVILLLKIGVAFAFLYPAISSLIDPTSWLGYVPTWMDIVMPREIFLSLFSTFEILLVLSMVFLNSMIPSIIAGITLLSIVAFNPSELPIVFRDISISCMAFALALLIRK